VPVEAGVADQPALATGAEQEAVLAGGEEAAEEGAVAPFVDPLDFIEALVGGDQRLQLLEFPVGDRRDLQLGCHLCTVARRKAALMCRDVRADAVKTPTDRCKSPSKLWDAAGGKRSSR